MMRSVLVLGAGRYLSGDGSVIPGATFSPDQVAAHRSMSADWDPDIEGAPGAPAVLTDKNRSYWESCAARGGHTLDDLMVVRL